MSIGERLREERERLGLSQPKFAALAGTTKQTLFSWESGKTAPDGFQLAAFAEAGVDVQYVLVGDRDEPPAPVLTAEEQTMLNYFRESQPAIRRAALGALLGAVSPGISQHGDGVNQVNSAPGVVQVGRVGGKVVVKGRQRGE